MTRGDTCCRLIEHLRYHVIDTFSSYSSLGFSVLLDTLRVISEMIFPVNHLTGAKQPVFPTDDLGSVVTESI